MDDKFAGEEQRESPRYDWHGFVDDADWLIHALKTPREIHSATTSHGRGLDLSKNRDDLAMLIAEAHEVYDVALEDWQTRRENSYPHSGSQLQSGGGNAAVRLVGL